MKDKFDDDSLFFGDDHSNDMAQFETYENFDIEIKNADIKSKAEKLVNSICSTYFSVIEDLEDIDENDAKNIERIKNQLNGLKLSEISVVTQLTKQISVAEHLLDTLLRRLDSGGFTDPTIYENIREQQKSLNFFAIEFSKYVRGLPDYFDSLRTDMGIERQNLMDKVQSLKEINTSGQEEINIDPIEGYSALPIRGTKDFTQSILKSTQSIRDRYKDTEEIEIDFDPKDIAEDEE